MERRIYVASLSDYNAGRLHGVWIDLAGKDKDDVLEEIKAMLAKSKEVPAEEWAIHDHEGLGKVGEFSDIGELCERAEVLDEGRYDEEALAIAMECWPKEWRERMEEYAGAFDNEGDYAEELARESGANLGDYERFINWEAVEDEMESGGEIYREYRDGKHYVFRMG